MRAIFISYRRDDTEGQAGRLFQDLSVAFGADMVFMDVTAIEPGIDFRKAIEKNTASCGVLLALIGRDWLSAADASGARRLDNPNDFVRLEISSALRRDIPVVPVLVQDADMPRSDDLPEDLKDLAFRNGVEITHARWTSDVQVLIKALRPHVEQAAARSAPDGHAVQPPLTPTPSPPPKTRSWRGLLAAGAAALALAGAWAGYIGWRETQQQEKSAGRNRQQLGEEPGRLAAAREAQIRAHRDGICTSGFVWRDARPGDKTCVTPQVRSTTARENGMADANRQPGGGAYGPNTCKDGFVWREAFEGDVVCVMPASRTQAARDNALAANRVVPEPS
ncbi:toll/interleukin-1 receptor domain-containing protein [Piscinibacter sp.]|uniref:toll/interleukin-1 receptor domain-containing protein n=1 Tax=Piscinibacter sp. TaxID=1903157 RepID=UPI002D18F1E0|nr:toll/interleukin-1 receptor domain-containing protein [Albitalea sp.]HUG25711.1 toll/interleukin-1 receptor domain-containing protein [Albitalea sp.]